MLDRLVAEIGLDGPGIDAVIRQFEAASVAQHVRVDLHIEAYSLTSALNHRLEAALGEWRAAFRCEHERRFGVLFTLEPPQGAAKVVHKPRLLMRRNGALAARLRR